MKKLLKFLSEVRAEFKNIAWPKKDTLVQLTVVVIAISVVLSSILGGFDYLFTTSIGYLGSLKIQPQIQVPTGAIEITPITTEVTSPVVTVKPSPNSKK